MGLLQLVRLPFILLQVCFASLRFAACGHWAASSFKETIDCFLLISIKNFLLIYSESWIQDWKRKIRSIMKRIRNLNP